MIATDSQKYCAREVRSHDTDRYLAAMFAPDDRRAALLGLYAFNLEIASVRESVSEPILGRMRLQWWREALPAICDRDPPAHQVAEAFADAVVAHGLPRAEIERLIEGRETDLEDAPPGDVMALERYVEATSSTLMALALRILGASGDAAQEAARHGGLAWGLTGLLRALPLHARRRRCHLPCDLMAQAGLRAEDVFAAVDGKALAGVVERIAVLARDHLDAARRTAVSRSAQAALLPLTLADAYLSRLARSSYDVFDPRLRMGRPSRQLRLAHAAWRGRY